MSRDGEAKTHAIRASPGHCIKSCIFDKFRDCEKSSIHADSRGDPTSGNEMLCLLDTYTICINFIPFWKRKIVLFIRKHVGKLEIMNLLKVVILNCE